MYFFSQLFFLILFLTFVLTEILKFYRFIEERSFVSDMDMAGLAFFDECTERVEEENGMNFVRHFSIANFNFSCSSHLRPFVFYFYIMKKKNIYYSKYLLCT